MVVERRNDHRIGKIATGEILFGSTIIECAILDVSDRGARLELSTPNELPSDFVLKLTEGNRRQCKVVWRDVNRVGVEFC
jgi:PilZ domain